MFIATVIVSVLLAAVVTASGLGKATKAAPIMEGMTTVGVPESRVPLLAVPLLAGAVGVVVGLWIEPIGIAAGIGLVLYFLLAVGAHLRVKDSNVAAPLGLAVFSAVALTLRVLSA